MGGSRRAPHKHYLNKMEVPGLQQLKGLAKQDVLLERLQSTYWSLTSKFNMLALSSRPDFALTAKMLTSRYGKATKSDFTMAIKLIK